MREELHQYNSKRDFNKTPEPSGESKGNRSSPLFVIQKHDASSLHYDFRLEVDGVLKSWAIPKGPSTDPRVKRLAIPTEDHPISYAKFEGVIPGEEYGGGTVLIWDRGVYQNLMAKKDKPLSMNASLENGHAEVWLDGEKVKGGYALIRTGSGNDEKWLLVKMNDEEADARRNPVSTEPKSVASGRTLEQIRKGYP